MIFLPGTSIAAIAAPGDFVIPASRSVELHAKGSNGFGLTVSASSNQVYLTVRGHHANNVYMLRGQIGGKEIKARFGRLGRVAMRFRTVHKARLVPEPNGNCAGGGEVIERGSFFGVLSFRGEQGYTTARTARAAGRMIRTGRLVCENGVDEGGASGPHWLTFDATSKSGNVSFSASKLTSKSHPELDGAFFSASIFEVHPNGMSVIRALGTETDAAFFKVEKSGGRIAAASAAPPAPFSGSAVYRVVDGAPSWTGTLSGFFPGRGEVSLAGPKFCAGFPSPPAECASGAFQVAFSG